MPGTLKKILIANRGEIALRVIRAARELGIATIAVYTPAEINAQWIQKSNEAYSLGEGALSETYLNIHKIISIARQSGADAIHPGYGFLSENYRFAEACEANNIIFIGPPSGILKIMGDKRASHELVRGLGIEVPEKIFGTSAELQAMEEELNYPLLVKAIAGGGGKGMRVVNAPHELTGVLQTTSNEALQYFADERIYIEDYLTEIRHIEIQVLGDKYGNIAHLFERECSVQRRHQKILEEAPAEGLSDDTRHALIEASLKIAAAVHFCSAGTFEFLVDKSGKFHFLEMNPRIQVEHGITEMVTGVDLVKEQIKIAGGHALSPALFNIRCSGHAIEARLYAEDPENDLLPSPGRINYFKPPDIPGIRLETAVTSGTEISGDYDPLIAKIIVHAASRKEAVAKLNNAINRFVITGIRNNLPLLEQIVNDQNYKSNHISTRYLDDKLDAFTSSICLRRRDTDIVPLAIAAAFLIIKHIPENGKVSPWQSGYWRNSRQIRFRNGTDLVELDYAHTGKNAIDFYHEGQKYSATGILADAWQVRFSLNGNNISYFYLPEKSGFLEISDGHQSFYFYALYLTRKFRLPFRQGVR